MDHSVPGLKIIKNSEIFTYFELQSPYVKSKHSFKLNKTLGINVFEVQNK